MEPVNDLRGIIESQAVKRVVAMPINAFHLIDEIAPGAFLSFRPQGKKLKLAKIVSSMVNIRRLMSYMATFLIG